MAPKLGSTHLRHEYGANEALTGRGESTSDRIVKNQVSIESSDTNELQLYQATESVGILPRHDNERISDYQINRLPSNKTTQFSKANGAAVGGGP